MTTGYRFDTELNRFSLSADGEDVSFLDRTPVQKTEVNSMLSADLRDSVAFEIGHSVQEVQAVFTLLLENRILHVWSVVPEHDRSVYRRIYAKEKDIIKQFEGVDFEFNVVTSRGRDPRNLITAPEAQLAFIRK